MEIMIELTDAEVDAVSGGNNGGGSVSFSFTDTASGTNASVSGTLNVVTTSSSAGLSGSFSSSST